MLTPDPSSVPASPCAHCGQDERTARQLQTLVDLAAAGMDLVFELRRQVQAAGAGEAPAVNPFVGDPMLAYARVSRAVRLTLALETRIAEGQLAVQAERQIERGRRGLQALFNRDAAETAVRGALEIEAHERGEGFDAERLLCELNEALDEVDQDVWLDGRSTAELAGLICKDLGVPFDPDLWDEETGCYDGLDFTDPFPSWPAGSSSTRPHTAHPGECRGPDQRAPPAGPPSPTADSPPPTEPTDLDPGIRREEREEGDERERLDELEAVPP
jgi:hypothetical protein